MGRTPNRLPNYLTTGDLTNFKGVPDYIITTDGTRYTAKNCNNGIDEFIGTDFTTVIEDCITALPLGATGGGHIHLKRGSYYAETQIDIPNTKTAIKLTGECNCFADEGTRIIANDTMTNLVHSYANFFYTKDIFYVGNSKANQSLHINSIDCAVDHCSLSTGLEYNIQISSANSWVSNSWIEVGSRIGVGLFRTRDSRITNNIFYNNGKYDIHLDSFTGITVPSTVVITGNRLQTTDNGIYLQGHGGAISDVIIADNFFEWIGETVSLATFHDSCIYCNGILHNVIIANNICNGTIGGTTYTDEFVAFEAGGTYTAFTLDNNQVHDVNVGIVTGAANVTQLVQNNSSTNVGVPGTGGQWTTGGYEGLIVHDSNADKVYVYVDGAWELLN